MQGMKPIKAVAIDDDILVSQMARQKFATVDIKSIT